MPEGLRRPGLGLGLTRSWKGPTRLAILALGLGVLVSHLGQAIGHFGGSADAAPLGPRPSGAPVGLRAPGPSPAPSSPAAWGGALVFGPAAGPTMPPDGPGAPSFRRALPGHDYAFPRDHGDHAEARTEWWYLTGQATDAQKHRYGYELTFFKTGLTPRPPGPQRSRWRSERLWMAHLALTDEQGQRFWMRERSVRSGSGLAGASPLGLDVRLGGWRMAPEAGGGLRAVAKEGELRLDLRVKATRPPVVNGLGGISVKGSEPGAASHYLSWPQLRAEGTLGLPGKGALAVQGEAWIDHEWGSALWPKGLAGWDWAGLNLDDGSALMIYQLRDAKGPTRPQSAGTWIPKGQAGLHLKANDYRWQPTGQWTSPHTGATYPMGWSLELPAQGLSLRLTPLVLDQELQTEASTRVTYWEGAVRAEGSLRGKPLRGQGYVELTGYAGRGGPGT